MKVNLEGTASVAIEVPRNVYVSLSILPVTDASALKRGFVTITAKGDSEKEVVERLTAMLDDLREVFEAAVEEILP